jgi:pimeloyl-ACP methyl ester carboxylesterase
MNSLNDQLVAEGVRSHVYQADQWANVADEIAKQYKARPDAEPIVLAGHSYGADNVVRIAQRLKDKGVKIDLIITLDAVTPPKVPANVVKVVNLYQSNGALDALPWLRGIPLEAERPGSVMLVNLDVRTERTDLLEPGVNHFNIEKQEKIHAEVIKQIKQVCVTRPVWAMRQTPLKPLPALTSKPLSTPTPNTPQVRLD